MFGVYNVFFPTTILVHNFMKNTHRFQRVTGIKNTEPKVAYHTAGEIPCKEPLTCQEISYRFKI